MNQQTLNHHNQISIQLSERDVSKRRPVDDIIAAAQKDEFFNLGFYSPKELINELKKVLRTDTSIYVEKNSYTYKLVSKTIKLLKESSYWNTEIDNQGRTWLGFVPSIQDDRGLYLIGSKIKVRWEKEIKDANFDGTYFLIKRSFFTFDINDERMHYEDLNKWVGKEVIKR